MPCGKGSCAPPLDHSCAAAARKYGKPPSLMPKTALSPADACAFSRLKPDPLWLARLSRLNVLLEHRRIAIIVEKADQQDRLIPSLLISSVSRGFAFSGRSG